MQGHQSLFINCVIGILTFLAPDFSHRTRLIHRHPIGLLHSTLSVSLLLYPATSPPLLRSHLLNPSPSHPSPPYQPLPNYVSYVTLAPYPSSFNPSCSSFIPPTSQTPSLSHPSPPYRPMLSLVYLVPSVMTVFMNKPSNVLKRHRTLDKKLSTTSKSTQQLESTTRSNNIKQLLRSFKASPKLLLHRKLHKPFRRCKTNIPDHFHYRLTTHSHITEQKGIFNKKTIKKKRMRSS